MSQLPKISITITLIMAIVGVADAAIGRDWDLLVLFLIIVAVQAATLISAATERVATTMRPDLARWVNQRAQRTGEPVDDIVDRALAWYQHGLYQRASVDAE